MLTKQQIFDKALVGVRLQGGPAANKNGTCRFRIDGKACGVGQLIADQDYDPAWDFGGLIGVRMLLREKEPEAVRFRDALMRSGVDTGNESVRKLVQRMQDAHDNAVSASRGFGPEYFNVCFKAEMARVAAAFGLEMPS
jgi:hypothetical protein